MFHFRAICKQMFTSITCLSIIDVTWIYIPVCVCWHGCMQNKGMIMKQLSVRSKWKGNRLLTLKLRHLYNGFVLWLRRLCKQDSFVWNILIKNCDTFLFRVKQLETTKPVLGEIANDRKLVMSSNRFSVQKNYFISLNIHQHTLIIWCWIEISEETKMAARVVRHELLEIIICGICLEAQDTELFACVLRRMAAASPR